MSDTRTGTSTRVGVLVLGAIVGFATAAQADPIAENDTFTTTVAIDSRGVTGPSVVSFQGVTDGALTAGSTVNLGEFTLNKPAGDWSTTYSETPFVLQFNEQSGTPGEPSNQLTILGILNGTISNSGQSDLKLNIVLPAFPTPSGIPVSDSFGTSDSLNTLAFPPLNLTPLFQDPNSPTATPLLAQYIVTPVPEPSTLAIVALLFLGGGLARRHPKSKVSGTNRGNNHSSNR